MSLGKPHTGTLQIMSDFTFNNFLVFLVSHGRYSPRTILRELRQAPNFHLPLHHSSEVTEGKGQGQLHTLLQCIALRSKTSDFLNYGCLLSRVHQSVVGQLHGEGGCARGQCPNSCRVAQKFSKWTLNSQHLQQLSISSLTQHHRKENLSNGGKKMFQDGLGK